MERVADTLTSGALGSWVLTYLTQFNLLLETLTLLVGLIAGIFALVFHYRRWVRERELIAEEAARRALEKLKEAEAAKEDK